MSERRLPTIDRDKVHKLWNQGLTSAQIAERLSCSRGAIQAILSARSLTSKNRPRHGFPDIAAGD